MSLVLSLRSCLPPRAAASPREAGVALAALLLCFSAFAERQPFERYQTIVDRQMFGPPPEGFDPTKRPDEVKGGREAQRAAQELTKEQEKLKSSIRFSMINVTPAGETAVGFTDSSDAKNPKNYYLKVGESRDGWTVKEADPVASSMTIVKGEIEVSLTIGGDSGKGGGKTAAASAANGGSRFGRQAPASGSFGSLRARRNQRRAEEQARLAEFDKRMKEREAALEKRQQEEQQAREEREARQAEEKARQDAQREEQRKQLLQIQEELKRAREEKNKDEKEKSDSESDEG